MFDAFDDTFQIDSATAITYRIDPNKTQINNKLKLDAKLAKMLPCSDRDSIR